MQLLLIRRLNCTSKFVNIDSLLFQELQHFSDSRLSSRDPIQNVLNELKSFNIKYKWREKWLNETPFNYEIITDPTLPINESKLDRDIWVKLNRLRAGHGRCLDCLFKWNLTSSPLCVCGLCIQTMAHIICSYPLRRFNGVYQELCKVSTERAIHQIKCLDLRL